MFKICKSAADQLLTKDNTQIILSASWKDDCPCIYYVNMELLAFIGRLQCFCCHLRDLFPWKSLAEKLINFNVDWKQSTQLLRKVKDEAILLAFCRCRLPSSFLFRHQIIAGFCWWYKDVIYRRFISTYRFFNCLGWKIASGHQWGSHKHGQQSIRCFTGVSTSTVLEWHKGIYNYQYSTNLIVLLKTVLFTG